MAGLKIKPPMDLIELAAAVEVAKTFAFQTMVIQMANAASGEVFLHAMNMMRINALARLANTVLDMPPEDEKRYRAYAEATIEELFGRLHTEEGPIVPRAS